MTVTAAFTTELASRYLQQLCKHFAHKVPATFDQTQGAVTFPQGQCRLEASDGMLTIECTANEAALEPSLVKVVEVHLQRFAWKEECVLEWRRDGVPAEALMAALRAMPDPHGNRAERH